MWAQRLQQSSEESRETACHLPYYLFTVSHAFMFSSLPSISSLNSIFYHYLHSLTWGSVKNSKGVLPVFINQVLQEHSDAHSLKYCLWLLLGLQLQELSRCDKDHIACKTKNIYFMKKFAKSTLVHIHIYPSLTSYIFDKPQAWVSPAFHPFHACTQEMNMAANLKLC